MGDAEHITEYAIAVDVLGKNENFKEGKDAIVRVEVHRLRKRLAEFYEEEGRGHRVRIVIPTGRYSPQFRTVEEGESCAGIVVEPPHDIEPAPAPNSSPPQLINWKSNTSRLAVSAALLVCLVGLLILTLKALPPSANALDSFWDPVLSSGSQVLLCVGNESGGHAGAASERSASAPLTLRDFHSASSQMVLVGDATALAAFAGLIQSRGRRYRVVSQSEATYTDLQNSPVILIGLLNNEWTKRLMGQLRFSVERPAAGQVLIRDHDHPSRTDWSIDFYRPFLNITKDYALILRATDPKTEQMVVVAGGMSVFGTMAAAEFLTNENELGKLAAFAPKDWRRKDLEVVLSTDVIRGHAGPPVPVATHFW